MKLAEILRGQEADAEPEEISVLLSTDALHRCNLQITLESIWMPSGNKDWMYRVDPEDPRIPLQRHIHIAKKKHTSAKNMQASWNADGTRHDKSSFNASVGSTERVRDIDLPGFSETLISRKMAPARRGADEEESIFRRANGHDPARSRSN
ncbi:DUF6367 family protein, partial [Delftia tsuruhatensis]|uniref:DUF6367 family protein n=1 Tax=Delftia tsuruhatensis TaxID=180282 RepID=UPI001EF42768